MSAILSQTSDPGVLVPGDAGAVRTSARQWRTRAQNLADVAFELATIEPDSVWTGAAADAFAEFLATIASEWGEVAIAYGKAAQTLDGYADILAAAQRDAAAAAAAYERGDTASLIATRARERATREAEASGSSIVIQPRSRPVDPGDSIRHQANSSLADAQTRVRLAGDAAADQLDSLAGEHGFIEVVAPALGLAVDVTVSMGLESLRGAVNGAASLGNAVIQHPEWLMALLGGAGLMIGGSGGAVAGGGLTLTGAGAPAGVPLAGASVGVIVAGAGLAAAGAVGLAGSAMGDSKVEPWRAAEHRDGRDIGGRYADGNPGTSGKAQEKAALDREEELNGISIERAQVKATVEGGREGGRFWDGLFKKDDGTYGALEVKSGSATRDAGQRDFDDLVSYENPATTTMPNGEKILVTSVKVIRG